MSLNDYVQAGREWEAEQERKRREAEFVEQHKRAAPKPTPDTSPCATGSQGRRWPLDSIDNLIEMLERQQKIDVTDQPANT